MIDELVSREPAEPTPAAEAATPYEPVVLAFTCNWCSYRAADLAGTARMKYPPNVRLVRLMCSGRLDPTFVMKAFASGADGVLMTGCWPADCHYRVQNVKALRRFELLHRVLEQLGIEPQRFQRFYASAAEGSQLAAAFTRMIEDVRPLGPLGWGRVPAVSPDEAEEEPDAETSADLAREREVLETVGA
ncbi:MAG TPA: hydrogenase iron-sulfur subunit [Candidatus Limnocylindrales bacterium]